MKHNYWLPDNNDVKKEYSTDNDAVIIIGANGSGKTRLGVWIEKNNWHGVHRVGAQRNLNFQDNIPLKNYQEAENYVFYGNNDKDHLKRARWGYDGSYAIHLIDDFNNVLAALIALKNNEVSRFHSECKSAGLDKNNWPNPPKTSIDKLKEIWASVFPHRDIIEKDSKFYAVLCKNEKKIEYPATQMSDGERSVLYLSSQVLCVPQNKTLIIDEPELHLNRSIMNRLWNALEKSRPDCLFIYITHDLQFAANHVNADRFWVKDFDGHNWNLVDINDEIPEELLLEVLGARRNVLFVEGEFGSYDYKLYSQLYPNFLIVPCGGCPSVISRTKSFKSCEYLHDYKVYGIIDRDYRSDYEIQSLAKDGIYVLEVAEVENLFIVEEVLKVMASALAVEDVNNSVEEIKNFIIQTKFKNKVNLQICECAVAETKYLLSTITIENDNDLKARESLQQSLDSIDFDKIKSEKKNVFMEALNSNDYRMVLRVFNKKELSSSIGHFLGIQNAEYRSKFFNLMKTDHRNDLLKALSSYIPNIIL